MTLPDVPRDEDLEDKMRCWILALASGDENLMRTYEMIIMGMLTVRSHARTEAAMEENRSHLK